MDKLKELWKNMTTREKVIVHLVIMVSMGALFFTLEYEPQAKRLKSATSKVDSVNQNLASYQTAFQLLRPGEVNQKIDVAQSDIVDIQDEIQFLKTRMSGNPVDVVRALRRQADKLQARMESLRTKERKVNRGSFQYKEITLQLKMISSFHGLGSFVRSLDNIPVLLSVQNLTINQNRELLPEVESDLTIQFYVL